MGKRILVVDDDPVIRTLVSQCLQALGHTVSTADCAAACREAMATELPEVLVLDCIMPNESGPELLHSLRQDARTATLPVLMLSANSEREAVIKDGPSAANGYLQKPFQMKDIIAALERL